MSKRGKNYLAAREQIDRERTYSPDEAIALAKETTYANFDETVELHLRLGVDPRQADQQIRDTVVLPHGLGKPVRVLVFAQGEGARLAEEAGADIIANDEETFKKIGDGWTDFDVAIATQDMMENVGPLGRVLGPRGLMPNPKAGTIVSEDDLPQVIQEAKAGRIEFRLDKTGNLHVPIGKVSFDNRQLYENMSVLINTIKMARPPSAKGTFFRRVTLTTSMGPGIKIDPVQALTMELPD